jgi:hypothetical protein
VPNHLICVRRVCDGAVAEWEQIDVLVKSR